MENSIDRRHTAIPSVAADVTASRSRLDGDLHDIRIDLPALIDDVADMAIFLSAPDGSVVRSNAGADIMFGYRFAEMPAPEVDAIVNVDEATGAVERDLAVSAKNAGIPADRWYIRADGSRFRGATIVYAIRDAGGRLSGFIKTVRDVTEAYAVIERARRTEDELRVLTQSVRDYAIIFLKNDGTIDSWNSGAEKLFGYRQHQIVGREFSELFSEDDREAGVPAAQLQKASVNGFAIGERWLVRQDGSRLLISGKITRLNADGGDAIQGFAHVAHDITSNHIVAEDLRRQAQYDDLTDLPNRRRFYDQVARAIALMKRRPGGLFAVLFVDLDHFKAINDRYGHIVADRLLAQTARRLEASIRSEDTVARFGGDEFAVLINGIASTADAVEAATRIEHHMAEPIKIEGNSVRTSVSVGIAIAQPYHTLPDDILREADMAMYAAKHGGRGQAVVFEPGRGAANNVDFVAELETCIADGGLRVVYQPIVRLRDGFLVGFEALVRWQHPRLGLLVPGDFLAWAERSDLILSIDRWVLEHACRQLADWEKSGIIDPATQISVNVSAKEFIGDRFVDDVRGIVESCGVDASYLRIEITETQPLQHSDRVAAILESLRVLGVELDFDDFGMGFSSLAVLQHISVDALKIDASFVSAMDTVKGAKIVEAVLIIAQQLGVASIAEGIETDRQLAQLVELGCDFGQGYLFAPPLDPLEAVTFAQAALPRA